MKDWNNAPTKKLIKILLFNELIKSLDEGQKLQRSEMLKLIKINRIRS